MAATIANAVYDAALTYLETNGTVLHICNAAPTVGSTDTAAATLGLETGVSYTGPADHTTGRKITLDAITDGDVTGTDTATHFAITTATHFVALVVQELDTPQAVTSGNKFTLTEVTIAIPDPTA